MQEELEGKVHFRALKDILIRIYERTARGGQLGVQDLQGPCSFDLTFNLNIARVRAYNKHIYSRPIALLCEYIKRKSLYACLGMASQQASA